MTGRRVRVKMCGMTRRQDIAYAAELGVDAIGLIFFPQSSRCVSIDQAKQLLQHPPLFVEVVAVLVNPAEAEVKKIIDELPVSCLQFHGDESPEFCRKFKMPYIKSIAAHSTTDILDAASKWADASAILLDTPCDHHRGGTGNVFDWSVVPEQASTRFVLAGGLTPDNVESAIHSVVPYAVDVCTGVEQTPGVKDHAKMKRFIKAVNRP